jgi:uncharacterized DUF497 family protein
MIFDWDETKRKANLRRHGIDFAGCESLFEGCTLTVEDRRIDYGEPRFVTIGMLEGRVVTVVHTETPDTIRIISIRKATRREQESWFESFAH